MKKADWTTKREPSGREPADLRGHLGIRVLEKQGNQRETEPLCQREMRKTVHLRPKIEESFQIAVLSLPPMEAEAA